MSQAEWLLETGQDGNHSKRHIYGNMCISETRLRQGVTIVIKPDVVDVFDIANMGGLQRFQSTIYSQLASLNGVESTGWREKKRLLIPTVASIIPLMGTRPKRVAGSLDRQQGTVATLPRP
jgi:hypothetical protein